MEVCPTCNQPIEETVVEGRRFIAYVQAGPYKGAGRYLSVLNFTCGCGVRRERRYENRQLCETQPAQIN